MNLLEVKDRFTTRDAQKFPLPQTRKSNFNNSSHDNVNSDGIGSSQRKAKGSINKSDHQESSEKNEKIVIEDVSDHDSEFGQERATNDPSLINRIDGNNSRDNKFENIGIPEEESESVSEKEVGLPDKCMESGANVLVDELNEEGNKNTKNVVLPHFVGDIEIQAMSKFDGCVDIDGYTWNRRRRRVNNAKKQNKFESYYQCNNCTATKIIIRKFDKSSKSITIRYLTPHSKPCTIPKNSTEKEKQSTQNVLKGGNEAEKEPSVEASVIDEQNEYSCAYDVMDDDLEKTIVEMENELEIGPQEAENAPEENISPNHLAGKNRNYGADESSKHRGESINISINPEDFFANANLTQDDSVNDNSLDNGKNNGGDEQREETIEVVIFKVRQKEKQLKLFKLKDDMERFCVEEDAAVIIQTDKRKSFDAHKWGSCFGGSKQNKGISTMKCQDGKDCGFVKKKWECNGLCLGARFCCSFYKQSTLSINVYLGNHDHELSRKHPNLTIIQSIIREEENNLDPKKKMNKRADDMELQPAENVANVVEQEESDDNEDLADKNDDLSEEEKPEEHSENNANNYEKYTVNHVFSGDEKEGRLILGKCKESFDKSFTVQMVQKNCLEARNNAIFVVNKEGEDKISPVIKDGYIYRIQTSRKKTGIPIVLPNQENVYLHTCRGKLVCTNQACPVLNRLTIMNSVPIKGKVGGKCRFCKYELVLQECNGSRYILRSKSSQYIVVKYTEDHTCGDPEPVLDEDIIDELSNMFNSNPELTPSNAYKSLLMRKIGEGKSYKEIINLVHCFTFDHHIKNIKASVKNAMQPGSDDLTSVMALKRFIKDTPELDLILKVAVDSYICEGCNKYRLYFSEDEETDDSCDCTQTMVNVGPIILVTSKLQVKAAFEMSDKNGLFKFSTLYLDNQNGRIINCNTLNAFFYDYQMQSISSIFTVHSKFEDKFSIALSFDLFNDIYKDVLNIDDDFFPHGFASDSAGGISSALTFIFGPEVRHRTCQFHYLYGAHQHCCNAIGNRDSQIRYLRFCRELLEAATPTKFELLYKHFVKWISKKKDRSKKLIPWLSFWYKRKSQWSVEC